VLSWTDDDDLRQQLSKMDCPSSVVHVLACERTPTAREFGRVVVMPREATAYARVLYAELHRCDAAGAQLIVVEAPPNTAEWHAITDRLARASA
jgi:L-threonylcarbamoyladenylate synthase